MSSMLITCWLAMAQHGPGIHGAWQSDQFGYRMTLLLNTDGTGEFDGDFLHFIREEKSITIIIGTTRTVYAYSLKADKLTLVGGDLDGEVVFTRVNPDPSAQKNLPIKKPAAFSSTSVALIGLWSGNGEMIEFKADGTCVYGGSKFPYQVSQGHLILNTAGGNVVFDYLLRGQSLELTANGQRVVYTRPEGYGAKTPVGERIPQELVGRWCYLNMNTNSQSSRCITLNQDGTFVYTEESSRGVNSGEVTGGTSSQGSDSGTWYVTGDRIYYHSASTGDGSYRLEKRNHPKNVNDPMIVLDGEAYVTVTARPPWR